MGQFRKIQFVRHDLNASSFIFTPPQGYSIEILEIGATTASAIGFIDITIGQEKMLQLPIGKATQSVCAPPFVDVNTFGLFETVRAKYPEIPTLKVGQTETLTIAQSGAQAILYLWYRILDGEDLIINTVPGGSQNPNRLFVSNFYSSGTLANNAEITLDLIVANNLPGYPRWPFEGVVPVNRQYLYIGTIYRCTSDVGDITEQTLQVWKANESILGKDFDFCHNSFFKPQDYALNRRLNLFPAPYIFESNEDMKTRVYLKNVAMGNATYELRLSHLFLQRLPE